MDIKRAGALYYLLGLWACIPVEPTLNCLVKVDFSQTPELFRLEVDWDILALQFEDMPLGPNPPNGHGVLLDPTWVELPTRDAMTRFVRSKQEPSTLYFDTVSQMGVGRVWPRALEVRAYLASGKELTIYSILEPITLHFPLRKNSTSTIEIELVVVRNLGDQAGTYSLYTKHAYWSEGLSPR
tara:strand:+ start:365 stop:913 length:549 start_codon:yes stop_codon:yes gene_type:complete